MNGCNLPETAKSGRTPRLSRQNHSFVFWTRLVVGVQTAPVQVQRRCVQPLPAKPQNLISGHKKSRKVIFRHLDGWDHWPQRAACTSVVLRIPGIRGSISKSGKEKVKKR
jgi:hypothetical protein